MITTIHRSKLEAHPDNPRKELGDLSELTASIRKQGILQNLTVVPHPDKPDMYRIVIGHRRFSASGIAGIDELPCSIDENMSYSGQIAVMMSENIQRNDLTITEKVGGVQMMMDLGMNASEISGNTGISDATVRKYARLSKLNRGGMRQAEQRGATLLQFAEICDIEDESLQKEALEKVGTNDYQSVMYKVRVDKARKAVLPAMLEKLNTFAEEIEKQDYSLHSYVTCYYFTENKVLERVGKPGNKKYAYVLGENNITLYEIKPPVNEAKEQAKREAAARIKARTNVENELCTKFKELRGAFLKNASFKGKESVAYRFALWVMCRDQYTYALSKKGVFSTVFCPQPEEQKEGYTGTSTLHMSMQEIADIPDSRLVRALVLSAYDRIADFSMSFIDDYSGKIKENTHAVQLYQYLCDLGYELSEEEQAWLDHTHECFKDGETSDVQ